MVVFFKVYSKTNCKFCTLAKEIIMDLVNDDKDEVEIVVDPPQDVVQKLKTENDHHTYPFIFYKDKFLGGYAELKEYLLVIMDELETKYGKEYDF